MTTAAVPNGATIFPGISSDPRNTLNQFLDTDGTYKWTIADGTVVLQCTSGGAVTIPGMSGESASWTHSTGKIVESTVTDQVVIGGTTPSGSNILTVTGSEDISAALLVGTTLGITANTAKSFVLSNASKQLTTTAAPTNGQLLIGDTGNVPALGTIAGTANQLTVTNAAHSITLSLPAALTAPGSLTVTTRTGTPASFACFDSGGKLVSSGTACA